MVRNRRSWKVIGGVVIFGGLLCGIATGQNALPSQITPDAQSASAGRTADAPVNQTAQNAGTPSTRVLVAQAAGATAQSGGTVEGQLQEVVVTATHFATQVNQTPLPITAITTANLLQEGINSFSDLAASVPSVNVTASLGTGLANIAIRGIIQNGGAATTGFYLDNAPIETWDTPLLGTPSETPLPPIFDLQRVEVLNGPQGTLFGASSEGGTIRYITPQPSLDDWHVYAKLDGSQTDGAQGGNYSPGIAVGGPIVPDVLGFRASVYTSHQAGWINAEDPFTQQIFANGLNSNDVQEFQGALLWKPTANFSATASFFTSYQSTPYESNSYDESEPYPIVVSEDGYDVTKFPTISPAPVCSGNAVSGLPNCATYSGPLTHLTPGATYGPYRLASNTILDEPVQVDIPASTSLRASELDLTYTFPSFSAQLFSTYNAGDNSATTSGNNATGRTVDDAQEGPEYIPESVPWYASLPSEAAESYDSNADYRSVAEDLRFTSIATPTQMTAGVFSWTGGLFYNHNWATAQLHVLIPYGQEDAVGESIIGETSAQRYGIEALTVGDNGEFQAFANGGMWYEDTDEAAYGEANYNITNNLQATGGVRVSHVTYDFWEYDYGLLDGQSEPTLANGAFVEAGAASSPVTPKGELTYRFTPNRMIYLLADEGFRPGGGNPKQPATICGPGAAAYGITVNDVPTTYGPDSDWNYELGTKDLVAGGHVQLNASVYHIDWTGVQLKATLPNCATSFITNAGKAASDGFQFSAQAVVLRALQLNLALGYDHAYYVNTAVAVSGTVNGALKQLIAAYAGTDFPVPMWSGNIGARLDLGQAFHMGASYDPYIRADWRAASNYAQTAYPASTYTPYGNEVPSLSDVDLRAGVDVGNFDINVYALNALNNDAGIHSGGPASCLNAACTSYLTANPIISVTPFLMPVTVGLQATYTR